jgi:hypothetical protein
VLGDFMNEGDEDWVWWKVSFHAETFG